MSVIPVHHAHVFQEDFENTASLFVDKSGDTLHSTTAGEAANGLAKFLKTNTGGEDDEGGDIPAL